MEPRPTTGPGRGVGEPSVAESALRPLPPVPGKPENVTQWDQAALWRFRAKPVRVKDGDTIVVLADSGYRGRYEPALRLARIEAPPLNSEAGEAARAWLSDQLLAAEAYGPDWPLRLQTVQRETVVEETTTFERWVSEVWTVAKDGTLSNLSDAIVEAGHASPRVG